MSTLIGLSYLGLLGDDDIISESLLSQGWVNQGFMANLLLKGLKWLCGLVFLPMLGLHREQSLSVLCTGALFVPLALRL